MVVFLNVCEDFNDLRRFTLELGAEDARLIKAGDVAVRDWVRLKCRYGCSGYGNRLTCPPHSPTPDEFRRVLQGYGWAVLLKFRPKPEVDSELQKTYRFTLARESIVKLERAAFLKGYYSAFGLAAGGACPHCDECNLERCLHPRLARPAMEAVGIDVYETVRKAGFELEVVKSREEAPTYFALLLLK